MLPDGPVRRAPARKRRRTYTPSPASRLPHGGAGAQTRAKPRPAAPSPKPYRPTRTQLRSSRAQAKGYRSQGKQVNRAANRQASRGRALAQERAYRSQGRSVQRQARQQRALAGLSRELGHDYVQRNATGLLHLSKTVRIPTPAEHRAAQMRLLAPALKVLDQTTRPLHAVAAAAKHDVQELKKGHVHLFFDPGAVKAASRGIQNKDRSTFSDVLKTAGVKSKALRSIGGFALDVGLDPTTYVGLGAASGARESARTAAEKATGNALKRGATKKVALREGRAAARKAIERHRPGVQVRFGPHRANIRAPRKVAAAGRGARESRGYQMLRHVNPDVRPPGVSKEQWERVRAAKRRERGIASRGERQAKNRAIAISRVVRDQASHNRITDAIESAGSRPSSEALTQAIRKHNLAPHEAKVTHALVKDYEEMFGRERAAKLIRQDLRDLGYVPRRPKSELEPNAKPARGTSRAQLASSKARTERRSRAELRGDVSPAETRGAERGLRPGMRVHAADRNNIGRVVAVRGGRAEVRFFNRKEGTTATVSLPGSSLRVVSKARHDASVAGAPGDPYISDVALSRYLRGRDSAVKLGRAQTYRELQNAGRRYKGQQLTDGEAIYSFHPRKGINELKGDELKTVVGAYSKFLDRRAAEAFARSRGLKVKEAKPPKLPEGRYIVLPKALVDRTIQPGKQRLGELEDIGRLWDRTVQGRIKTILTVPNPQYHLTNLYGDLFNAYRATNVLSLARNMGLSTRVLIRRAKVEAAAKTLDKQLDPTGKGVRIAGKKVGYDELIKEAEQNGAIGQGFLGRDLPEVLDQQGRQVREQIGKGRLASKFGKAGQTVAGSKAGRRVLHPLDTIRDVSQYREDAVRLAVYLDKRRKGMTPEAATKVVADHLYDYGDLSQFERSVLRRVFPFWTFTARNTVSQAKTLFTHPGKVANIEKIREELTKASGLPPDYEANLQDYEQRGVPFPIPGMRSGGNQQLLYPKLPITDLNRLGPQGQIDAILSMVTPIIKSPIELSQNYSFFFKGPLDKYGNAKDPITGRTVPQLKPVPTWLAKDPRVRALLGIRRYTDKRTNTQTWGWPAKTDYVLKQTPFTGTALQTGTDVPNSRGQTSAQRVLGYLTGLKFAPYDKKRTGENVGFAQRAYLQAVADSMRNQGYPKPAYDASGNRTPDYQKVLDQIGKLERSLGVRGGPRKPSGPAGSIDWSQVTNGNAAPSIDWSQVK